MVSEVLDRMSWFCARVSNGIGGGRFILGGSLFLDGGFGVVVGGGKERIRS